MSPHRSTPFVLLVALLLSVGACKRAPRPSQPAKARPTIALVMKSLANEFFKTMEHEARLHQQQNADRYDLITNGIKDEADVGRQIDLIEQMVARGVDAIVLAPADSKALLGAVKRARDAGVVVVNIDNRLDEAALRERGLRIPFVGPDNRKGAREVGLKLASQLQRGAQVAIIEGLPTAFNGIERRRGFEEAVQQAGLSLVSVQAGHWEMAKANQLAAALLTEHPKLAGILCANDSMALGVVAALKAAGKLGKVQVAGFDNIQAMRDLLDRRQVAATADQHGGELAVFGVEAALDILAKRSPPADRETPVQVITAENL